MTFTRRHVLGGAAALAAVPLAARAALRPDIDVAIVGGGVSGVYAAWRLRQEQPYLSVRLFEASGRIGGRLHSIAFPQAPHLVAEAGGMRFLEAHRHVFGLVKSLGL
ncbi:MAG TPA: FAD-dependent oxidoreductase, partial [Rhizomicrobium sp.]|nr:FAD-dependent oxidoreductase [Rhizomicrobium sp.]